MQLPPLKQPANPALSVSRAGQDGAARTFAGTARDSSDQDSSELPPEGSFGEAQPVRVASGLPRLLHAVAVNFMVLAEVFVAMYFASRSPDEFTPVFFKVIFAMLLPTFVLAFATKRLIDRRGRR